jgi:hypothetical protein
MYATWNNILNAISGFYPGLDKGLCKGIFTIYSIANVFYEEVKISEMLTCLVYISLLNM